MLADQYLQRYRERGDVGDLQRAQAQALRSLRLQPRGNVNALRTLGAVLLTLHRFREARDAVREARAVAPDDPSLALQEASLDMELGSVPPARTLIARFGNGRTPQSEAAASRLAELTGRLGDARRLLDRASRRADAIYDVPAERRAWFHVRLGEMAFNAGDVETAIGEERTAIARFPAGANAWTVLARIDAASGDWPGARDAAAEAVRRLPSPENLGLLADAQHALGDDTSAAATRDQIEAVARIGNTYHLVDRLLALYYADHRTHLADAYATARRELSLRDDVYAEDTLAWTAAQVGAWDLADRAARKATRLGTQDPRIWYHAAIVDEHAGRDAEAVAGYRRALALNAHFAPGQADDARARLARLTASR